MCTPVPTQANIKTSYKLLRVIGTGHFGTVRLASPLHSLNEFFAVKVIDKHKLKGDFMMLRREIQALSDIAHPNIIKYYEVFEDSRYFSIVTEYCSGGDLFDRICEIGHFTEADTVKLMKDILRAVCTLHAREIVHRDIKPANFLFASRAPDSDIKLIDFGLSNKFGNKFKFLSSVVGTPNYIAPEVLKGSYDNKCDMWSAGVIMFILLSGHYPFQGINNVEVFSSIKKARYSLENEIWETISDDAKDLLGKLLIKDPSSRLSAQEALDHAWFKTAESRSEPLNPEILNCLRQYKAKSAFQKEALNVLARRLKRSEIEELTNAFATIDRDNTGLITSEELQQVLQEAGYSMAQQDIEVIMKNLGMRGDGRFGYSDFIAATIGHCFSLKEEEVWMCFRHFDTDQRGFITAENLDLALKKVGRRFTEAGIHHMLDEADFSHDGVVSYDEFRDMLMAK